MKIQIVCLNHDWLRATQISTICLTFDELTRINKHFKIELAATQCGACFCIYKRTIFISFSNRLVHSMCICELCELKWSFINFRESKKKITTPCSTKNNWVTLNSLEMSLLGHGNSTMLWLQIFHALFIFGQNMLFHGRNVKSFPLFIQTDCSVKESIEKSLNDNSQNRATHIESTELKPAESTSIDGFSALWHEKLHGI